MESVWCVVVQQGFAQRHHAFESAMLPWGGLNFQLKLKLCNFTIYCQGYLTSKPAQGARSAEDWTGVRLVLCHRRLPCWTWIASTGWVCVQSVVGTHSALGSEHVGSGRFHS